MTLGTRILVRAVLVSGLLSGCRPSPETACVALGKGDGDRAVLAREGLRRGLEKSSPVAVALEEALARATLENAVQVRAASADEVEAEYRNHLDRYQTPQSVQAFLVFFAADALQPAVVDSQRKAAAALARDLKARPANDFESFAKAVAAHSTDPSTRAVNGNLGVKPLAEVRARYGPAVLAALLNLENLGQVSSAVETPEGFYVLKLVKHVPARQLPLPEAEPAIRARLAPELRARAEERYVTELRGHQSR